MPKKPKRETSFKATDPPKKREAKKQEWESQFELLNEEQKVAFEMAISGKSMFIGGAAGSGKTFLLSAMIKYWKTKPGHCFAITASTGMAATNLSRMLGFGSFQGTTIHSWSGLGANKGYRTLNQDMKKIYQNKSAMENWFGIHTLIIEEISMLQPSFFDRLEELARKFKDESKPFGGIQVIACGDWSQLEPVKKDETPEYDNIFYCFKTKAWEKTIGKNVVELFRIYRQKDVRFLMVLHEMRQGALSKESIEILESRKIDKQAWLERKDGTIGLYPRKNQVLEENTSQLAKLEGKEYVFEQRWIKRNINDVEKTYLMRKMLDLFSFEREPVKLKVGASVILTVNLSVGLGLVNGLQGTVVDFGVWDIDVGDEKEERIPDPELQEIFPIVAFQNGMQLTVARYKWYEHADPDAENRPHWDSKNFKGLGYSQIPIKLGFASSIHSAQGMGFEKIGLDIGRKIFSAGQAYTGVSRCTTIEGLRLIDFHTDSIITREEVLEFYREFGNAEKREEYYKELFLQAKKTSSSEAENSKQEKEGDLENKDRSSSKQEEEPMSVSKTLKLALDSKKNLQDNTELAKQRLQSPSSSAPKVKGSPF